MGYPEEECSVSIQTLYRCFSFFEFHLCAVEFANWVSNNPLLLADHMLELFSVVPNGYLVTEKLGQRFNCLEWKLVRWLNC